MAFSQTMSGVMEHVNNNSVSLLEISIKSLEHHITPMSVPRTSSVLDLKTKIQSLFHIDKRRQRLIFQGRVLKDEKQLLEYGDYTLQCSCHVPGVLSFFF
jgi:hypothetical protein